MHPDNYIIYNFQHAYNNYIYYIESPKLILPTKLFITNIWKIILYSYPRHTNQEKIKVTYFDIKMTIFFCYKIWLLLTLSIKIKSFWCFWFFCVGFRVFFGDFIETCLKDSHYFCISLYSVKMRLSCVMYIELWT